MAIRTIGIGILASLVTNCAWAQWSTVSPMQLPRQETCAAIIGDAVYVCGGIIGGGPVVNTASVEKYLVSLDQWMPVAPMPLALDHAGAASLNGKLYVIGGFIRSGGSENWSDEMHVYDPASNTWSAGTPLPQRRAGHWAVALNGKIYVIGGVGSPGGVRAELYEFNPTTNNWTTLAPMSEAREHLNAATDGTYLYVIGGRNGGTTTATNERYDPGANTWTTLAQMPTARSAMGVAVAFGDIHCMGGEIPVLFDDHEVYNIASNTWTTLAPMAVPRHGLAAVTLPSGGIFVPAGGILLGIGPTAHTDIFGTLPPQPPLPPPLATPFSSTAIVVLLGLFVSAFGLATIRRSTDRE